MKQFFVNACFYKFAILLAVIICSSIHALGQCTNIKDSLIDIEFLKNDAVTAANQVDSNFKRLYTFVECLTKENRAIRAKLTELETSTSTQLSQIRSLQTSLESIDGEMDFGIWSSCKIGKTYAAETSGFVIATIMAGETGLASGTILGTTSCGGGSNVGAGIYVGEETRFSTYDSFMMPVKKGCTWKVEKGQIQFINGTVKIYWVPVVKNQKESGQ